RRQAAGRPGGGGSARAPLARALQGQGRALRQRSHRAQRDEEEVARPAMIDKNLSRLRRAKQTRHKIREVGAVRLTVHRTNSHIDATLTSAAGDKVLASASSTEKEVRGQIKNGGNRKAAEVVGSRIAQKAKAKGIQSVAFDRAGYKYHGRVKTLA